MRTASRKEAGVGEYRRLRMTASTVAQYNDNLPEAAASGT
jgi:hypothetical protein